jgi:hypothetical protein
MTNEEKPIPNMPIVRRGSPLRVNPERVPAFGLKSPRVDNNPSNGQHYIKE